MSTTYDAKGASNAPTPADRIVNRHRVLGTDAEGRVHHYDHGFDREYISETGGRIYVVGDDGLEHVEDLEDRGVDEWAQFIDDAVCGWEQLNLLGIGTTLSELAERGVIGGDDR